MSSAKKSKEEREPNKKEKLAAAKKRLYEVSHSFIRERDSVGGFGRCIDCKKKVGIKWLQCGHFIPDQAGNILLRYHPHNMHGQFSGCNLKFVQERVKINYTLAMLDKYGREYVDSLIKKVDAGRGMKVDLSFYETMISLYEKGDENEIINYLNTLC